jgi:ADP-ribose pyrophosphatase YjhB (NUDIX family)
MMLSKDRFCSFCGTPHSSQHYPRTCSNPECKVTIWSNPIPVAVVLQPVRHLGREGLLVLRRGIEPGKGKLALVGGFAEDHESVEQAGAREMREETGVQVAAASLTPFWFTSSAPKPNRVLLFLLGEVIAAETLPPMQPSAETQQRGIVFGAQGLFSEIAFPLHLQAIERFFALRAGQYNHDYSVL